MVDITVVNWADPSAFLLLQAPGLALACWLAFSLARSYIVSIKKDAQRVRDGAALGRFKMTAGGVTWAGFHLLACWLCCAALVIAGLGLAGVPMLQLDPLGYQLGGMVLVVVVGFFERFSTRDETSESHP
jgi:hypothetical protein